MKVRVMGCGGLGGLRGEDWVDGDRRAYVAGGSAYVPVREGCSYDTEIPERHPYRGRGFQLIGDIALVHGHRPTDAELAGILAEAKPRGVLWLRGFSGVERIPSTELLCGTAGEVCHRENGCRYWLDPSRVMFAQGNLDERRRMGGIVRSGERVADCCAGIGYFAIPMAAAGADVHACELNPVAHGYLCRNIAENRVNGRVTASCGDCRVLLEGIYDRFVIGHFEGAEFVAACLEHARPGSVLHVHSIGSVRSEIEKAVAAAGFSATIESRRVKKYGPRQCHLVEDVVLA